MKKRRRPAGRGLALLAGFVLFWTGAAGEIPEEDWQITEIEDVDIGLPVKNLLAADLEYHTPNENSPVKCSHAVCSWNRPMGLMDEASVWEVLTAPVTVLAGNQRQQCRKYPRRTPIMKRSLKKQPVPLRGKRRKSTQVHRRRSTRSLKRSWIRCTV